MLHNVKASGNEPKVFYKALDTERQNDLSEELWKAERNGTLVSIFADMPVSDYVYTGFVVNVFDHYILFASISEEGIYDGYIVIFIEDIFQIQHGREYERRIQELYGKRNKPDRKHVKIDNLYNDAYLNLLHHAYETDALVAIELFDSGRLDIEGRIECFDPSSVCIRTVTQCGDDDGAVHIPIDTISRLECDTLYTNSLEKNFAGQVADA